MLKIEKQKLKRKLTPSKNFFLSLASSIIYQQISTKAGDSIYKKFLKLFGRKKPTPKLLLEIFEKDLRSAGLSNQKLSYLKDLARKLLDRTIDPRLFQKMSDEEVKSHLTQVKGIGPWTADMFLIFALNRPNVLPVGDLGIAKGFQRVFKLKSIPSEKTMIKLAKPYYQRHTFLSLYLWESIDERK